HAAALERLREALRRSFAPPARECEALRALADALAEAGRHEEAVGRLREALALAPGDAAIARALAQAAGRAGQTALSAHAWEEVAVAENAADAWLALADAAEALGDRPRVRRALEAAVPLLEGAARDPALARLATVLFEA